MCGHCVDRISRWRVGSRRGIVAAMQSKRAVIIFLLNLIGPVQIAGQLRVPRATPDSQTVVFVCEHGTVKSVVAMAWFTRLSRERHLPVRAISRGTALDAAIPDVVRKGLKADGFEFPAFTPTVFTEADLAGAIAVISLDEPTVGRTVARRASTQAWNGLPSVMQNYEVARDSIRRRVRTLVDSLSRQLKGP